MNREHDDKPPSFGGNLFLDNTKEMVDLEKTGEPPVKSAVQFMDPARPWVKSGLCHGKSIYKWMRTRKFRGNPI